MSPEDGAGEPVALVTGASRGLGQATARALGLRGWSVVATARTEGGLAELDDELRRQGRSAVLAPLDLASAGGLDRLAQAIRDRWRRLDLLVHMAAAPVAAAPVGHIDAGQLRHAIEGGIVNTQRVIAACDPLLRDASKPLALFALDSRLGTFRGSAMAAKWGMEALVRCYHREMRRGPVRVAGVEPPIMATAMRSRSHPGENTACLADAGSVAERIVASLLDRGWPGADAEPGEPPEEEMPVLRIAAEELRPYSQG